MQLINIASIEIPLQSCFVSLKQAIAENAWDVSNVQNELTVERSFARIASRYRLVLDALEELDASSGISWIPQRSLCRRQMRCSFLLKKNSCWLIDLRYIRTSHEVHIHKFC